MEASAVRNKIIDSITLPKGFGFAVQGMKYYLYPDRKKPSIMTITFFGFYKDDPIVLVHYLNCRFDGSLTGTGDIKIFHKGIEEINLHNPESIQRLQELTDLSIKHHAEDQSYSL